MDDSVLARAAQYLEQAYGGFRIRAFEPVTEYIGSSFITEDAAYLADENYVVTVARSSHHDMGDFWPEMPWLFPAEVRVLAAVALAVPEGRGAAGFAPHRSNQRLGIPTTSSLIQDDVLRAVEAEARELCQNVASLCRPDILWTWGFEAEEKRRHSGEGETRYRLRDEPVVSSERLGVFQAISLDDALLLRGLYCLLKGQHLSLYQLFWEEAFMNAQIAREAALELIRARLAANGVKNASYADAHQYLREHFLLGGHLADYLLDQHEKWVATRHPNSRHGAFWTPPLMMDDYIHTHGSLVSVYRHLLLDEPGRLTAHLG
jgi:hypothetical protein